MNDCKTYREMISSMLDGELSDTQKSELEAHMAVCAECRAVYDAFLSISNAVSEPPEVPAQLHDAIMSSLRRTAKMKGRTERLRRLRPYLAAAACFVLVLAGALTLRQDRAAKTAPTATESAIDVMGTQPAASSPTASAKAAGYEGKAVAETALEPAAEENAPAEFPAPAAETKEAENIPFAKAEASFTADSLYAADSNDAETDDKSAPVPAPVPTPVPEPIEIDLTGSVIQAETNGSVIVEALSREDTLLFLTALVVDSDTKANTNASYIMEISAAERDPYTVYMHLSGGQLQCSLQQDFSDAVVISSMRDFADFVAPNPADEPTPAP